MQTNWKLGLGYSLCTALMWGILPIALKGLLVQMETLTIVWYRFSASALIAFCWYGYRNGPALKHLMSGGRLPFSCIAIAGLLGNYYLYTAGLDYITPSASQIIIQLAPLLLLIGGVALFREQLNTRQWFGVAGFAVGLLLFFHLRLESVGRSTGNYLVGVIMVVGAAVTWTAYSLAQRYLLRESHSNNILLTIYIAGSVCFLPMAEPAQILALNPTQLALLGFVALNTIIAYGSFGLAMSHWEVSRVSAVITLAPMFTLLFGQLLNAWHPNYIETEPLDWLSWTGAVMVLAGSAVAALARSRQAT